MEIRFNQVSYKDILTDIDYNFEDNKVTGIMGVSGSGKTALIELINANNIPTRGNIIIGSKVITKSRKIDKINLLSYKIGIVYENPIDQFFCETVKEEIEFTMKYFHKTVQDKDKHISQALMMVGLDDSCLNKKIFNLSLGQMRKIAIASVLAYNPKIIILDNPTVGLDNKSIEDLIKLIKLIKKRHDKTVIVISNDTDFLLELVDNVILLDKGKIVLSGDKYEVFKQDIEKYGIKQPKIIKFQQLVFNKKNVRLLNRDDINDLMKDIYRCIK